MGWTEWFQGEHNAEAVSAAEAGRFDASHCRMCKGGHKAIAAGASWSLGGGWTARGHACKSPRHAEAVASENLMRVGDYVALWEACGLAREVVSYGEVIAAGISQYTVCWDNGQRNRIQQAPQANTTRVPASDVPEQSLSRLSSWTQR